MGRWLLLALVTLAPLAAMPGRASGSPTGCPASLPGRLARLGAVRELITVEAPAASSTSGTLETWSRLGGCWRPVARPWQAWLGVGGVSAHHHEGDATTPEGRFAIGSLVYGTAPDPGLHDAYRRVVCGDWWDEDPRSAAYNTFVQLPCGATPDFGGDSEALWRSPVAYAHFALIDYNTGPIVPGAGSAIFLHASIGGPTDGCVSLPRSELDELLGWLRPDLRPTIVIATAAELRRQ